MLERIIRSEAHFAAMLFCELRKPSATGERFLGTIESAIGEPLGEITHVFVEPAPFRDTWVTLDTSDRWRLVNRLLHWADPVVDPAQISSMFNELEDEIRSPASWDKQEMQGASSMVERLRFMFRARPDLLVITTKFAVWIELKVDSKSRQPRNGYYQPDTQQHIAEAAHLVVPELTDRRYLNLVIQREPSPKPLHFTWQQIVGGESGWEFDVLKPRNR